MAEIIQKNLGKFLVTLTLVSVFIAGFFIFSYFSAKAQEEIKILPESFTGDWQNPEAVFSQDLGSSAAFAEFNQENSAYPLEIAKEVIGNNLWMRLRNLFRPEAQAESAACKNGTNQSCSTEVGACRIGVQICQDGVWGKCIGGVFPAQEICDGVDNNCDGQIDEGACAPETCQNGANRPCSNNIGACRIGIQICQDGVWGKCIGAKTPSFEICDQVDNDCDGQTDEGGVCGGKSAESSSSLIEKTLVLAGFGITPIENSKISLAQMKLSLAGKGSLGDKLIIDYFYNNIWHNLAVFDLENEISNALNGGFFVYGLPIFENWSDLNDLRIKFTYLSENASRTSSSVFLDAAWLELETAELEKQISAEPPLQVVGEGKVILKSIKKDWRRDEEPEFEISDAPQGFWEKVRSLFQKEEKSVVLIGPQGSEIPEGLIIQDNKIKISLPDERGFRAGLYKLKISITEGGEKFIQEQEFTWGVLAINTNKSIYLPDEQVYIQMAALRNDGRTICDANLKLEITPPNNGNPTLLNVESSGKCGPNNVIDVPDYFAYYQIGESGAYQIKLTNLDNGYEITDSFEVRESVPFDIERIGPTRIYPLESYPVTFSIISNQDFKGVVEERVPASFKISQPVYSRKYNSIREEGDVKLIRWEVSLQAGEQIQFGYRFDAPDISPYLYLSGPLKIGNFQEIRQWQIASDLINEVFLFWDGVANTPDGTWTCVSCSGGDTYYEKFPIGSSTAGLAGGTGTHTHTLSFSADGGPGTANGYDSSPDQVNVPAGDEGTPHNHSGTLTGTSMTATTSVPAYYELKVIKKENPTTIPAGVIAMFDTTSLPSADWQLYTAADNLIIRGGPNASTSSANGHTHSGVAFTTAIGSGSVLIEDTAGTGEPVNHTHSYSGGVTNGADSFPPYIGVILAKTTVQVNLSDSSGMIAMFDNTSLPADWAAVDAINNNLFLKATSTAYGLLGGSATHGHPDTAFTTLATAGTQSQCDRSPANEGAAVGHTHSITVSFSSGAANLPPYVGTIFAKYTYTPTNAAPTITNVVFHDNNALTLNEWTQAGGGTVKATTTFTVTDTNTCADISTTTLYLYHSDVANCSTTAQASPTNCYPSTSTASAWRPVYGAGDLCSQTSCSGDTATFLCTSTLYFSASSTAVWMVFASTSDLSYAQANRTSNVGSAQATVNALQALEVSNDIAYATLLPGQDSSQSWVTTTATSTGNTAIDIKFHGGSLTKTDDSAKHIPAFRQQFTTTSNLTYGDATVVWLATSTTGFTGDVHDVTMVKATGTVPYPSSADKILWGIGIPSGQAIGTYSSTTNFVVTTAIVVP